MLCSNRTLLELKLPCNKSYAEPSTGSNRTLLELKLFREQLVRITFTFQSYLTGIEIASVD